MANSVAPFPSRGGALVAALGFALLLPAGPPAATGAPQTLPEGAAPPAAAPPAAAPPAGGAPEVAPAGGVDFARDREAIFKAFYSMGLDTSKAYSVTNLVLKKDSVTFLLKQGHVFLQHPLSGEVTGAAFVGEGEISMTPPNRTERYMLKKYYGAEVLKEPFSEAVFRFSDGTDRTIVGAGRLDPAGGAQGSRADVIFRERNAWLNGTRELKIDLQFLENRISGLRGQDFFVADFHSGKHDWLTYVYDPQAIHEHRIVASETMGAKGRRYLKPWTIWHESSDYAPTGHYIMLPDRDGPRVVRVTHTDLTIDLKNTKTVEWTAKTRVEPQWDGLRCLRFDLDNNAHSDSRWYDDGFWPIRVTSVADEGGANLPFMHVRDQLLVILPSSSKTGVPFTLTAKGEAEVIYQVTPESFGLIQANWYPQYGYRGGRFPFHWTVRVPRPFTITGSGKVVAQYEDKERNQNVLELQSETPVNFPWAIFGRFWKSEDTYTSEMSGRSVKLSIHTVSIGGSGTPMKKVEGLLQETKDILNLHENLYGPYPYEELHIAQMGPDLGFGQGPPYFVQLTGELFLPGASTLGSDSVHNFLSHEIAHQWWGNQIGWASDDDDWVSEGFASYAAAIFIEALQKKEGLKRLLDEWRMQAKNSDKEAPIAAASSLEGPNAGGYRFGLLYCKAPYVLHMLRVQLDDDKYREVMRSIQETYKHRDISTEMLLREVNRVTKADYTSFFDQWVWDVGIPTFRYRWRSEKQPDGKFLITVNVRQDDKDHVKKVLMPVHIHFKDKMIPQYRPVVQAEQEIKILSPMEPKNVTLDDDRTLLAEFVKES